jgi:predicted TIM-barrel fold metal-dependent hydrolase
MIVDFHAHYTPPELLEHFGGDGTLRLDERGNPNYRFNPLLADLSAHIKMMDHAGIDVSVLSCGSGFDQPNVASCRLINDHLRQAQRDYPGRFIGLAHAPVLDPENCAAELRRCAVELGFPGVAIASEIQGQALDTEAFRPFWKSAADHNLYVFIHPLPKVIDWRMMDVDDLGRMLGWEFSLMVMTVRLINSRLLDALPPLKIHISHFAGGIGRYLPRIYGLQDRDNAGTAMIPRHGRRPEKPFRHYLENRLYFDCAGWSGRNHAAEHGAAWVRMGLAELPRSPVLFATDYPQAVHNEQEIAAYVEALRGMGEAEELLSTQVARKLIPSIEEWKRVAV